MGTLKVNGDISATGSISASSFLGNASSATYTYQWASTETNPSTSSTDSNTTTFNRSNSRIYWVDSSGVVLNQPSTWGYILDIGNNAERHQIWMTQNIGSLYHRGGNAQGWGCAWTEILDASNYTSYTVTKTGSGASGTWGINISGNAATASKWATARTLTIGNTGKSVDGSSNVSWSAYEIGVPYVYHTGPGFSAYSNWGMMISRTGNTYGESGKGDNYYIVTDASNNLRTGHQLNGTANITWTEILNERNYMNYCAPASHNHTSLSNITSLTFATYADDSATIGANVDGSSTYFDFNLLDDGAMDKFRWRFGRYDSATATMPWSDLMTLTTISPTDSTAYLRVNGTISADWFSGTASNASYLVSLGGTTTASVRNYDSNVSLATGGWADANAGYGYTWGTTLDVSGYSTWYHRLAFRTDGNIEYWHGINTKTMSKVGNLCFTDHSHSSYLLLSGGTMTGTLEIKGSGSDRATLEVFSSSNIPCDLWLGSNNLTKWSITCRASDENYMLGLYNKDNNYSLHIKPTGEIIFDKPGHQYGSSFPSSPTKGQIFFKT